jgi:hypothetical protein
MMRLNGWKRIGIISSVVWTLGAGMYTLRSADDARVQFASQAILHCEQVGHEGTYVASTECDAIGNRYLSETSSWPETLIVAFVPVPLGWGLAYLILSLARWVKRGFLQPL